MKKTFNVMTVFGIRPDFIRSSIILRKLLEHPEINLQFVYTGQHYDDELKGVFFRELNIPEPNYVLDTRAETHVQQHAKLISQLEPVLKEAEPDVCLFLGDANAVIGCIAPLKMGIPIAHVEAGMRSHDLRMPEEKNRIIIDRVSDVLYAYQNDYKCKLVQEGIDPDKIVVTGNTIVDVLNEHMDKFWWPSRKWKHMSVYPPFEDLEKTIQGVALKKKKYGLMTLHRDEHMNLTSVRDILFQVNKWASQNNTPVILIVMPRLKKILDNPKLNVKSFSKMVPIKPVGFFDFITLERGAMIEFTDSGTNQETSAILGTPCVVTRRCTERPETFDSGITVMTEDNIFNAANYVMSQKRNKDFSLGDGKAADIIVNDLVKRLHNGFVTKPFMSRNWKTFDEYHSSNTNI